MKDLAWGTIPGSDGPPVGFWGRSFGVFWGYPGHFKGVEEASKVNHFVFSRGETRIRFTLNLSGSTAFRETTRERVAIIDGTFEDSVFPHENIQKSYRFVVNSAFTKGVLVGFR